MNSVLATIAPAIDAFTSMNCAGAQRRQRDHKLGEIAQGRVEQPTGCVTRPGRHGLRRVAQQRRQRHYGEHGQHEEQRVRLGFEPCGCKHHRHEGQQPQHAVVADLVEQRAQ